ncbi:Saccharopine dehydrogenase-like oxidoreductase [Choanephora cucurbitarum]|uniref:Saccharopine dehydrogenase-like oxidoreductase n=1 Tax=Choanephora cucurbitarum TaxID=101091 RepID=A0A1C7NNY3_9FUNG|nr:Saccharopine dehydrogenase-like oxidoreductase [Choanephora cucurbitarum]
MAREFDFCIFGGTGLTGKQIVRHVFELSVTHPDFFASGFQWAIAGRNAEKLEAVIDEFVRKYPEAVVAKPSVLVANVTSRDQIDAMTTKSKVLINAVGPFRFMGEYVVRSCVETGCNYVDVTGEPEFIERMQRTYQEKAKAKGVTIVHACGFDSVPTDLGVLYTKQLYTQRNWTINQIEMFLKIHVGPAGIRGGYATFESAVHGFGSAELLKEIRKASTLKKLPKPQGQKLQFHSHVAYDNEFGYHVPFVFADPSVVRLSQQIFLSGLAQPSSSDDVVTPPPTVQFAAYMLIPSLWYVMLYFMYGIIFSFLAKAPWGRQLLLDHPALFSGGVFSKEHPTQEQLDQCSFEVILRSKGYDNAVELKHDAPPNQTMKVVVRGPELGYVATPRIVVQCAMALLNHPNKVPHGVLTPSTAFWRTDIIEKLRFVGITCDVSC